MIGAGLFNREEPTQARPITWEVPTTEYPPAPYEQILADMRAEGFLNYRRSLADRGRLARQDKPRRVLSRR